VAANICQNFQISKFYLRKLHLFVFGRPMHWCCERIDGVFDAPSEKQCVAMAFRVYEGYYMPVEFNNQPAEDCSLVIA
jgi:hypothetical protein